MIPFPSEPELSEGDIKVFNRAVSLINSKLEIGLINRLDDMFSTSGDVPAPAAELTFHDRIGAHDIFVIHVLDSGNFIEWVQDFFKDRNVDYPGIPDELKKVIAEYILDGYKWFVFDVVSLGDKIKSKDAIKFRFKTDHLYYPLRITRSETGKTKISLLISTKDLLSRSGFEGIPSENVVKSHDPVTVFTKQLETISPDFYELLGKPKRSKLRIWYITGDLPSFKEDLVVRSRILAEESHFWKNPAQEKHFISQVSLSMCILMSLLQVRGKT